MLNFSLLYNSRRQLDYLTTCCISGTLSLLFVDSDMNLTPSPSASSMSETFSPAQSEETDVTSKYIFTWEFLIV